MFPSWKRSTLMKSLSTVMAAALVAAAAFTLQPPTLHAQATASAPDASSSSEKPNILVIFGDDVGIANLSAYTMGMAGYRTPNIDRIAREGMIFTDYYGENSCTAGRSTFITGQNILRTGLSKVGEPGAKQGLQPRDVTIAQVLKSMGYGTAQFGKNHLGDRNEYLPTNHGFDEFFGNLYHLNAEEEPQRPYWPSNNPEFVKNFTPRGVIHSYADGKVEDTGPLNTKRMETIDDETTGAAVSYIKKQADAKQPFFVWMNFTRMHMFTHIRPDYHGKAGLGAGQDYADGMWEMDQNVGKLLKTLDDAGVTKNTIVIFTTDNGPNFFTWPDAANSPFRSEKDSTWEGAFRVPGMVRWPGHIRPNTVSNTMISGLDWFPTLVAAAGDSDITNKLLKGTNIGGKNFKVHLDGYNFLPYLTGKTNEGPRKEFYYFNDDAKLMAMRMDTVTTGGSVPTAWKIQFCEQRAPGGMQIWMEKFDCMRIPKLFNLRMDPYERADVGPTNSYYRWMTDNNYLFVEGMMHVKSLFASYKDYPPSQIPASFTIDQMTEALDRQLQQKQGK
ncbi:arylsulfatase [Dyella silvae]|uniref:arylsulfatase n=1 Tax=Dyella silvae TaxID=2994424 RepID=UPI00226479AA|nr:arylsulfatase [Dyella silvae]